LADLKDIEYTSHCFTVSAFTRPEISVSTDNSKNVLNFAGLFISAYIKIGTIDNPKHWKAVSS
jgi:hypothetical protein